MISDTLSGAGNKGLPIAPDGPDGPFKEAHEILRVAPDNP